MPRAAIIAIAKSWGRASLWLLRVICNIRVDIRGLDKIPAGALLVTSKHQSAWETFALFTLFDDPAFILKRELQWLPLFGWYTIKGRMIPINRSRGAKAMPEMAARARAELAAGRQLLIFPEGTRRPVGAEPRYKFGAANLYADAGVPCLPVALNSGLFWPRRTFLRYPGTVRVEILDPIPPGLSREDMFERMRGAIEEVSNRLIAEGRGELADAHVERAPEDQSNDDAARGEVL
ncbi:MAG: 1-acyl-sn-glycerol-3-phosphate acyltransferase [Xanthobacteraceae bacterium]|nr:MAG: 1-acyl-sn-glycerol-3-phosphate acyltransferase [Xanthobacteraceae bacterium]